MFHKLIKLSSLSHKFLTVKSNSISQKYLVYANSCRFYCKEKDVKDKCAEDGREGKNVCITSRKSIETCKPPIKIPCIPAHHSKSRTGPIKCKPPSKMDTLPVPCCPWDEKQQEQDRKYRKHLLIGVLVTAATLTYLIFNVKLTKKDIFQIMEEVEVKKKLFKRPKPTCRIPRNSEEIPAHVPYLLIGGGTASFSAFRAIKSSDPQAKVLVVSNECHLPYMRPPLSKEVWYNLNEDNVNNLTFKQWNGTERSLFYEPREFYMSVGSLKNSENGGVAILLGYSVQKVDVTGKKAYLDNGQAIEYDKCLIATGASPKNLAVLENAPEAIQNKVTLFRDIFDYQELSEIVKEAKSIAIIGGGFLGSELACSLGRASMTNDLKVYQIFKENGNMGKILPEYLSSWTTNKLRRENVNVINNATVEDVALEDKKKVVLHLSNGNKIAADHVIVALGVKPNTELATSSDLEVDEELGGYLVNAEMEARSNLYIAGDCCCFYDTKLGRRRVEHHDHAVVTGRLAGENMTGAMKPYLHQSMFWSDLGPNIGYEAIGRIDSRLPTVAVFAKAGKKDTPKAAAEVSNTNIRSDIVPLSAKDKNKIQAVKEVAADAEESKELDEFGKGVIFYLKEDTVVGIVLWNVFNRMQIARQVLSDERKYDDLNEVAKLFNIHGD